MLEQRIQEEIQDLTQHPHATNISLQNQRTIKLAYSPADTDSAYKDKFYGLEIVLPETYPQDPPSVRFLDRIYHLNINYESGQVRMGILEEDWSPFLSLTSVIETLDHILEEPEEMYPAASEVLHEFENDKDNYFKKVLGSIDYSIQAVLCASGEKQPEEEMVAEADAQYDQMIKIEHKNQKRSSQLVQELRDSIMEIQMGGGSPIKNHYDKKKSTRRDKIANEREENVKESILFEQKDQKYGKNSRPVGSVPRSQERHGQGKSATLHKINETINVFIQEIQQIEKQMQLAKTPAIKTLLKTRYDGQFQMLKEMMELSESIKKGLVRKLKEEANRI